jgi:hypothetical protein
MKEVYQWIAVLIVAWAIPTAFDPKYRYNEHCKWKPDLMSILFMCFLGLWVIVAIFLN